MILDLTQILINVTKNGASIIKLVVLIVTTINTISLSGQFNIVKPDKYYDKFHFGHKSLFTYNEDYLSYRIDTGFLYNDYLSLEILNISGNTRYFYKDGEGIYLPYDCYNCTRIKNHFRSRRRSNKREHSIEINTNTYHILEIHRTREQFEELLQNRESYNAATQAYLDKKVVDANQETSEYEIHIDSVDTPFHRTVFC